MRHENQHWDNIRATVEVVTAGAGQTGLSPTVKIYRQADGQWWDGSNWGGTPTQLAMNEVDAVNLPGYYDYHVTGIFAYTDYFTSLDGYTFYIEETVNNLIENVRVVPMLRPAFEDQRLPVVLGSYGQYLQNPVESLAAHADAVWDEPLAGHTGVGTAGEAQNAISSLPTAGQMADAVWDEPAGDHTAVGSTGEALNNIPTVAQIADGVWDEPAADHNAAGSMGEAQNLAASGLTAADIADAVWDEVASDHTASNTMGRLLNVSAGLLQYNHRFKNPTFDPNGRLLTVDLALFHSSAAAQADAGAFATITLEMTYDVDGNLATILGKD